MTSFYDKQRICPNCEFKFGVTNNFCPDCGQKNSKLKIGFGTLITGFLGDVFNFDSKIFRSLWTLVTKPGKLTKDFNDGKRASQIPPLRMFLVLGIIAFSLIAAYPEDENETGQTDFTFGPVTLKDFEGEGPDINLNTPQGFRGELIAKTIHCAREDSLTIGDIQSSLGAESLIDRMLVGQITKITRKGAVDFENWLFNNFSLMVLFMVPLFAIILKLFYLRRGHYLIDHMIFSIHQHSAVYLGITIATITRQAWLTPILFMLILPVYTYFAMKKNYNESRAITLVKQGTTAFTYFIVVSFVFLAYLLIGFTLF